MDKTNYSYETSLPPYKEDKSVQVEKVLNSIKAGNSCLLAIAENLKLPQSTIAGRVNDLIEYNKVLYKDYIVYKGRKRKQIITNDQLSNTSGFS